LENATVAGSFAEGRHILLIFSMQEFNLIKLKFNFGFINDAINLRSVSLVIPQ